MFEAPGAGTPVTPLGIPSCRKNSSGPPVVVVPAGQAVGAVTNVPFEQATVWGPKPPAAAGEA